MKRGNSKKKSPSKRRVGRPTVEAESLPRFYTSMANCASVTGTPLALLKTANKKGCKAFQHSRVDFVDFLRWLFTEGMDESNVNWHEYGKKFGSLITELEYNEMKETLIDFATVSKFITNLVSKTFFGELDRLSQEFPPALKGKTEVAIHEECIRQTEAIKNSLRKLLATLSKKEGK